MLGDGTILQQGTYPEVKGAVNSPIADLLREFASSPEPVAKVESKTDARSSSDIASSRWTTDGAYGASNEIDA